MMNYISTLLAAGLACAGAAAGAGPVDISKLPPAAKLEGVTYTKDIHPLFEASCLHCHGEERPKAGLRLDTLEGVLRGSKEGKVIEPGKSAQSRLVIAVSQLDPESAMPPRPRPGRGREGKGGAPNSEGATNTAAMAHSAANAPAGPAGRERKMGPPAKPLTVEQVALVRAWIDQGAK